jgi:hypothetical protein
LLVTDLFKVYKTRIWMSAINPASFATPTAGIAPPSGLGPGALGVSREPPTSSQTQNQEAPAYSGLGQYNAQSSFAYPQTQVSQASQLPSGQSQAQHNPYAYPFQPQAQPPRGAAATMNGYGTAPVGHDGQQNVNNAPGESGWSPYSQFYSNAGQSQEAPPFRRTEADNARFQSLQAANAYDQALYQGLQGLSLGQHNGDNRLIQPNAGSQFGIANESHTLNGLGHAQSPNHS